MIKIVYTPKFFRKFNKLVLPLQEETKEKIDLFKKDPNHPFLRTHKLKGRLEGCWSFSVNYEYRIIFTYDSVDTVALLTIGDHDIYK